MGYRNYIGYIPKEDYHKIKDFTKEELYKYKNCDIEEDWVAPYDVVKEIYELGKYVDMFDETFFKPFFENEELQSHMNSDGEFLIVEKEFVKTIIERYTENIKKYYNEMYIPFFGEHYDSSEFLNTVSHTVKITDDDILYNYSFDFSKITQDEVNAFNKMINHVRSMRSEWVHLTPYDLDNGDSVTTSWKYEYEMFELVRIYKYFDWENNIVVYYGY